MTPSLEPRNSQTGSLGGFTDQPVAEIVPNTQPNLRRCSKLPHGNELPIPFGGGPSDSVRASHESDLRGDRVKTEDGVGARGNRSLVSKQRWTALFPSTAAAACHAMVGLREDVRDLHHLTGHYLFSRAVERPASGLFFGPHTSRPPQLRQLLTPEGFSGYGLTSTPVLRDRDPGRDPNSHRSECHQEHQRSQPRRVGRCRLFSAVRG